MLTCTQMSCPSKKPVSRLSWTLEQTLFPTACVLCGATAKRISNICCACRRELPRFDASCSRCGLPLCASGVCARCQHSAPPVDRTLSAFAYAGQIPYLVKQLKFAGSQPVARLLGELLYDFVAARLRTRPQAIIPVPLHRQRLRARGYNQALEVSRTLHQKLGIPLVVRAVKRIRSPLPQTLQKTAAARRRNVDGVFEVDASLGELDSVVIVDDVMTSGATVFSLATALRARSIVHVQVWTVARAGSYEQC